MRKYLKLILFGVVLFGIVALFAQPYLQAGRGSASAGYWATSGDKRYSTKMKELRNRFNQDRGKVRLLMLLSPT